MPRYPKVRKSDAEDLAALLAFGEQLGDADEPPPPPVITPEQPASWYPDLNPTQKLIFEDPSDNVLGYGEKGSGKSIAFGHKIVRHAYEVNNALALLISPTMRTAAEGIWHDLDTLILPQWRDGIGLEYTISKLDPLTKDRHRWIRNRHGGWSKLLLMSILHPSQVEDRVKGPAPSMIYIDELTNCRGREYFTFPSLQLGRRRGDHSVPQQFLASCNPEGPSHWVYQLFFVEQVDPKTGKRDPAFAVYHVPASENRHRLPPGYVERLEKNLKSDPVLRRRLINGEWIDRPTGDGLFKEFFIEALHIKGDRVRGIGLRPVTGYPIIVGYDLGQVFSSVTFEQLIPTREKPIWIVFDEVDHLGEKILYKRMAWEVIERMRHWQKLLKYDFQYMHITDESAINQWRPGGEGSYDAWEFEREYNRVAADLGCRTMRMQGCPKGPGSVAARIRMLQGKLYQEEIYVSATCPNARDMLMFLESDKDDPDKPRRTKHLHKFDSLTYPMFKLEVGGSRRFLPMTSDAAPSLVRCGSDF